MVRIEVVDTNADNILEYGICGYSNVKRPGYLEKVEWPRAAPAPLVFFV
jgi:hypothetical protein